MKFILIETSTERGVIALVDNDVILFEKELPFGTIQTRSLLPDLADALNSFGNPPPGLDAIAVGIGPGSYTGIRLGVAAAQALGYAWKVPLVGVSSLDGYVTVNDTRPFAALIDARIGGVYLRKGRRGLDGIVIYDNDPEVRATEELEEVLAGAAVLVTPNGLSLKKKLMELYPSADPEWLERSPCITNLSRSVKSLFSAGKETSPPDQLKILYLRKTEAERKRDEQIKAQ